MFAWVLLGHFPLVAVSHIKKENKQNKLRYQYRHTNAQTHEEYLIEDLNLRLRSALQSSYSCNVSQNHNVRITKF